MIALLVILGVIALAVVGLFAWAFAGQNKREGNWRNIEAEISTAQIARRDGRLYGILDQIGGPECPDGTYSPRQIAEWQKYNARKKHNQRMERREFARLVDAQTVIDDRTQYELDNGINPYKRR
jgi:hypothetical protein